MKNLLIFLFLITTSVLTAQNPLPVLRPDIDPYIPDFSPEGLEKLKQMEQRFLELNQRTTPFEQLSKEDQWILTEYDDTKESPFEIIGARCSWYCGGDSIGIRSSSHLPNHRNRYSYVAKNAHDLSFETAWVEGARGNGIGEYLEYRFDNTHPRVTQVIIHNGYVKSEKAWRDNGRVKKLKMILDGRPYAILALEDTKAAQRFTFEPLGRRKDGKDMYIRFEIMEVHPGAKYEDVAITEIYFDGIDVHCLAGESKITMADHSQKRLDEIKRGEVILTYHPEKKEVSTFAVQHLLKVEHERISVLHFDNDEPLRITPDHPVFSLEKGWVASDPAAANEYQHFQNVQLLEPGEALCFWNASAQTLQIRTLKKIAPLQKPTTTFAISGLPSGWGFFANGLLVAGEKAQNPGAAE
jgi:hypothetical protein